jgi:hypothetical protein
LGASAVQYIFVLIASLPQDEIRLIFGNFRWYHEHNLFCRDIYVSEVHERLLALLYILRVFPTPTEETDLYIELASSFHFMIVISETGRSGHLTPCIGSSVMLL